MSRANRGGIAAQFNLEDPEQLDIYHLLTGWLEDRKKGNKDYIWRHLITDMALELIETGREPKKGDKLTRFQSLTMHRFDNLEGKIESEINELKAMMMQGATVVTHTMQADVEYETEDVGGDVLASIFSDHRATGGR